ncbi:hypothetical protein GBA52_019493 [Prunus armeniaca]|nr:hypothetical protein GBA52_019493 [Prunus armeniaca]
MLAIRQCGIHPNGWCSVLHGAFVFPNVTRNLRELLPQIIRNLIAFVTLLALNKAADRADAIGMEIFKTMDRGTFRCSPREWGFYVFWFAL